MANNGCKNHPENLMCHYQTIKLPQLKYYEFNHIHSSDIPLLHNIPSIVAVVIICIQISFAMLDSYYIHKYRLIKLSTMKPHIACK